jgi:uncharacterized membrane protein
MTKQNFIGWSVFLFLLIATIAHLIHYYPLLPDKIAINYTLSGNPVNWTTKTNFVYIYTGLLTMLGLIFTCFTIFLSKLPSSFISLPNKEYWFAKERKNETISVLSVYYLWISNATIALILAITHITFRLHTGIIGQLGKEFKIIMITYILIVIYWSIRYYHKFQKIS